MLELLLGYLESTGCFSVLLSWLSSVDELRLWPLCPSYLVCQVTLPHISPLPSFPSSLSRHHFCNLLHHCFPTILSFCTITMPSSTTKSSFSSMSSSLPSIRTLLARKERAATRLLPAGLSQPASAGRSGATSILSKPTTLSLPERTTQSLHLTSQQDTRSSFHTSSTVSYTHL